MLKVLSYPSSEGETKLAQIATRKLGADLETEKRVVEILAQVRSHGDEALVRYTRQFDAPHMQLDDLTVQEEELKAAYKEVDEIFLGTLRQAIVNIEAFHRQQLPSSHFLTGPDGTFLGRMVRPVRAAGLYIPGGRSGETPLISSVLMNGIPARIAGVQDLALITPPRKDGSINPHLLVAAQEVGVTRMHKTGSAWGIGALAYGTSSIKRVDVVVGPGNIYVALAKRLVSGEVGIDLLAGPSEILIIADESACPSHIAADLLSQAEHDSMASALLLTTDRQIAAGTVLELEKQLEKLPRRDTALESLRNFGGVFMVPDLDAAFALSNKLAPEHLELQVKDPWSSLGKVENAGAVFLGDWTPEAVGDYFAGPNHVLPTAGTARFASALSVESFLKRTSVISYSRTALERDGEAIMRLARLEGLEGHAASVEIRLKGKGPSETL